MKKWVVLVAVVLVGIFLLKSTRMASVGRVWLDRAKSSLNKAIPPEIEIESLRGEIARMDNDIRKTLRPLAEKMVSIEQEEQAIKTARVELDRFKNELVRLTDDVERNSEQVSFRHETLTLSKAKHRLNNQVSIFEHRKGNLESRERKLGALRESVAATQEQLNRLMEQKRSFSEQLEQIVADLEVQKLNEIAKPLPMDNTKVSSIQERLQNLRRELKVTDQVRNLAQDWEPKLNDGTQTTPTTATQPAVNLNRIRSILGVQNAEGSKVAAGDSSR
jgi:chromosome segregation ATPase